MQAFRRFLWLSLPHDLLREFCRCFQIRFIRFPFVNTFEFAFAVKFPLIYRDADLIRLCFYLLPGGIQHGGRTEIDNTADLGFVKRTDKIPHLRIDAEGIIGVSEEEDMQAAAEFAKKIIE